MVPSTGIRADAPTLAGQERLDALLDVLTCGVLILDADRRVVRASPGLPSQLGIALDPALMEHRAIEEIARLPQCAGVRDLLPVDAAGPAQAVSGRHVLADGRVLECAHVAVHGDGGQISVYRDVSAAAGARDRLRRHNRTLAELVALKAEFLLAVSHELRTPLTSVRTFTDLLAPYRGSDPGLTEIIGGIQRSTARLTGIVDDLLLLAQLQSGALAMECRAVDLPAMVGARIGGWRDAAHGRAIEFECAAGPGPPLTADGYWLGELLGFLAAVAIAGAPPEGPARLLAEAGESGWQLRLLIGGATPGEGIGDRIYTFVGAPAVGRGVPMALMLARAIIALHHGTMTAAAECGQGISVWLPYRAD